MRIKVYDKVVESFGRSGYKLVGSKMNRVIGSTIGADAM